MPRLSVAAVLLFATLAALAPADDAALLQRAGVAANGPAALAFFQARVESERHRAGLADAIGQLGDDRYAIREAAEARIEKIGLPAVTMLREAETSDDAEVVSRARRCRLRIERVPTGELAAACARTLARDKPAGAVAALFAYLPIADAPDAADAAREAIAALTVTTTGTLEPAVLEALVDATPARRAVATEALARTGRPDAIERVRPLMADPDPDVALRATLGLATHAGDRPAAAKLVPLLATLPAALAWRAEDALLRLAGDDAPTVSLGIDTEGAKKCRDEWQAWWDKAGATADVKRLQTVPPSLGRTLVVGLLGPNLNNGMMMAAGEGRVYELDHAGKLLWQIDGLRGVYDAAITGPDRVAIAEFLNSRVTERDFTGKVVWSRDMPMVLGVHALPAGGLLVVARNGITEFDAQRKSTFTYPRQASDLVAARKSPTGEYVMLLITGQCLRLGADRKEERAFNAGRTTGLLASLDVGSGGRVMVTRRNDVVEFVNGESGWSSPSVREPSSVQSLANGSVLVATAKDGQVVELDRAGQETWKHKPADGFMPWRAKRR